MYRSMKTLAVGSALSLLGVGAAAAEEAATALDEVIVTAQRRSERLADVPAAVTAIGADRARSVGAQKVSELADYAPNLAIQSNTPLGANVIIRGVGSSSRNIGFDSRVGVYLDGVYLGQSPAVDQELLFLDRIEVLRGPQGALFGKNTVAGAINLIAKRPTPEFSAQARLRLGNLDLRQAQVRLNGALADGVSGALAVGGIKRDGYIKNLLDGRTAGTRNALSYRAQLQIDRFEGLQIYAAVDGLSSDERGNYGDALTDTFAAARDTRAPRRNEIAYNRTQKDERQILGASVEVAADLPAGLSLKSITSFRNTDSHAFFDVDRSPLDLVFSDFSDDYQQLTQELQLTSPKGGRLEYLLGLYAYRQLGESRRDALGGTAGPAIGVAPGRGVTTRGKVDTDNLAAFGNATFALTERWKLGAGFRLSREEKEVTYLIDGTGAPAFAIATGLFQDRRVDNDISPTATLTYALDDASNAYVRYAEGYKSGGYNLDFIGRNLFPNGLEFDKETARNVEAGVKLSLLDGRATVNAAIFRSTFRNYQVFRLLDLGGGRSAFSISNAGSARSQGVEVEATVQLGAGFTARGGLGLLDAEFTDYPGGGPRGENYAGKRLPMASKAQGSLGLDYERELPGAGLILTSSLNYTYRGGYFTDVDNFRTRPVGAGTIPYGYVRNVSLVDGRVAVAAPDRRWEAALWARNLFDESRLNNYAREFLGALLESRGEPRTFGLELTLSY